MKNKRLTTTFSRQNGNIRISMNTLEVMNYPKYINVLINKEKKMLAYQPTDAKDGRKITIKYSDNYVMLGYFFSSANLLKEVFEMMDWDSCYRYQVCGTFIEKSMMVVFDLTKGYQVANSKNYEVDDDGVVYDIDLDNVRKD